MRLETIQTIVDELSSIYRINGDFSALELFPIKVSIEDISNSRILGFYIYIPKTHEFKIIINKKYNNSNSDDVVFSTIWHEMCHFISQIKLCDVKHNKEFRNFYNLMLLKDSPKIIDYKYQVKCLTCGVESGLFRLTKNKVRFCTQCGNAQLDIRKLR